MNTHNDIIEELKGWNSPLAGMSRTMPYRVPAGYFEGLAGNMQSTVKYADGDDPVLHYSKQMPYQVPQDYFDNLAEELLTIARAQSALLEQPKLPFEVPQGYFSQLPAQILAAAKAADAQQKVKKTKVINANWKTLWTSTRWAAAAVLILGIALSTYTGLQKPMTVENQLAALPAGTIDAYVEQNIDDFETELIVSALPADKTRSAVTGVDGLTEEEITEYLDETGWGKEIIN